MKASIPGHQRTTVPTTLLVHHESGFVERKHVRMDCTFARKSRTRTAWADLADNIRNLDCTTIRVDAVYEVEWYEPSGRCPYAGMSQEAWVSWCLEHYPKTVQVKTAKFLSFGSFSGRVIKSMKTHYSGRHEVSD